MSNNAVVHTEIYEERYVTGTQSIGIQNNHTPTVISALMNASICPGGALDYDREKIGEESKLETIYNKMMRRGRRYDIPILSLRRTLLKSTAFVYCFHTMIDAR